ncbi:MAG: DUF3311 domain-containing protein [Candidatus Eremiobacteraeota bacterium]|nr:DUF3311 domain-containing protein [Candidatus Eremiobacteraeota bacterium]MBV9276872.1 DUF3311 domain-containing protein [Candidatus Eremiobacteraeota bacterium]
MKRRFWYWLLLLPFIATLYPPFYARHDPVVFGFPFFYWYQLVWVVLAAVVVGIVLMASGDRNDV